MFSGPLGKLAAESRELDYRVRTSDPEAARCLADGTDGIRVVDDAGRQTRDADVLVVRALVPALDELVAGLVTSGIAVRELAPVVSPSEAAFLALTESPEPGGGIDTWYQTHDWTKPYPGDKKVYAPNDVPGAYLPSPESDG